MISQQRVAYDLHGGRRRTGDKKASARCQGNVSSQTCELNGTMT